MDKIMALPAVSPHSPSFVQRNNSCHPTAECLFCHYPVALREQSPCTLQPIIILYFLSVIILCFPPSSCALRAIVLSKCQKKVRGKKKRIILQSSCGRNRDRMIWPNCRMIILSSCAYVQLCLLTCIPLPALAGITLGRVVT